MAMLGSIPGMTILIGSGLDAGMGKNTANGIAWHFGLEVLMGQERSQYRDLAMKGDKWSARSPREGTAAAMINFLPNGAAVVTIITVIAIVLTTDQPDASTKISKRISKMKITTTTTSTAITASFQMACQNHLLLLNAPNRRLLK